MNATSTRGRTFTGTVTSDKMSRTVTVEWQRRHFIPKYERYEIRKTKVKAHNPDEIDAKVGDIVIIKETRPLSKTKHFIIIKKLSADEQKDEPTTTITPEEAPVTEKQASADSAQPKADAKKTAAPEAKKTVKKTVKKATKSATKTRNTTKKTTKKTVKKTVKKEVA